MGREKEWNDERKRLCVSVGVGVYTDPLLAVYKALFRC